MTGHYWQEGGVAATWAAGGVMTTAEAILVLDADAEAIVAELTARRPGHYLAVSSPELPLPQSTTVCLGSPGHVLAAAPRLPALRWVQSTWAGTAPLLPLLEQRPQLRLTGVKGIFGPLMAQYVFGWLAVLERRLFDYREQQKQRLWRQLPESGTGLRHMVVLGTGSIGSHLARTAVHFGFRVSGVSRSGQPVADFDRVQPVTEIEQAVAGAEVLLSVLPDTPASRDLIDVRILGALAPGAIVINVGRGSVLVEADLLAALASGQLSAAVLDVFREEPLPAAHPFWTAPNLYLTPHVAAVTPAAALAELFLDNLSRYQAGEPLAHEVDAARGY